MDRFRRSADDRHTRSLKILRQIERCLATILHNHTGRVFDVDYLQYIFQSKRLKIKSIGCVVVGRYRFRITVDHDRLVTARAKCHCRMHTTVIKLNTLTDSVRSSTQDHDLIGINRFGLTFNFISGVHVSRRCSELTATRIHPLVDRMDVQIMAQLPYPTFCHTQQCCQTNVGKSFGLPQPQLFRINLPDRCELDKFFSFNQVLDLG